MHNIILLLTKSCLKTDIYSARISYHPELVKFAQRVNNQVQHLWNKVKIKHLMVLGEVPSYRPPRRATDLHEPVQENCPHVGLQMRMILHHVDVSCVGLVLLQHVVPDDILTGPTGEK